MTRQRQGFALLVVLWVMVGIGILALGAALSGRSALATAGNRIAQARAHWLAEGCIARVQAAADQAMTSVHPDAVIAVWDSLDLVIATSPLVTSTHCMVTTRATGDAIDVNTADPSELSRLFAALGIAPSRADSLIDALLDWRDADTIPRPLGAERSWYVAAHRLAPRDAPLANPGELAYVRGFEHFGDTLAMFTTEPGRIPLSHAPLPVLAALPGFTPEAIAQIADWRLRKQHFSELVAILGALPGDARATLLAHYAELSRRTVPEPDGWTVTARTMSGVSAIEVAIEVRLARAGTRVAILQRR